MFVIVRSISVETGKNEDARKWAIEATNFLNKNYPGHNVQTYVEWFGSVGALHWSGDYENLAAWENLWSTLSGDTAWAELLEKSLGYFVAGSLSDLVVERID